MNARLPIALLILTPFWLASSALAAPSGRGLGARPGTPEEQALVAAVVTELRTVAPNDFSRTRAAQEAPLAALSTALPAAVDNSSLPWFPPIGDQGYQNSCVGWAAGYYYDTYTQAKDEGYTVSTGDTSQICSPSFLYPLLNDGLDDGAYLDYALVTLGVSGCSALSLTPYQVSDYTTWPSEAAWVDALDRRTVNVHRLSGRTTAGLDAVKQVLANGDLALITIDIYANLYSDYPQGAGADNGVLYAPAGPLVGGHAVTLVGYDDARTYRDQRDGLTHQGAFLIANSWGNNWGVTNRAGTSRGFLWIAYDAFLEGRFVYDVLTTDDRPHYRPQVYALVGLDGDRRGDLDLRGGAGLPSRPDATTAPVLHYFGGASLPVTSAGRIAVDLTDLSPSLPGGRLADVFVSLGVRSGAAPSGRIASAEFFADPDGDGSSATAGAAALPVTVGAGGTGYAFAPLFSDVNWDSWAYSEIEACFEAGLVSGYTPDSYQPAAPVTRDQMAVYLARALAGGAAAVPPGPTTPSFPDVPSGHWAYDSVEYARAQGIVQGYGDGYHPSEVVDRAQMAVYLARSIATPKGEAGLAGYTPPATPSFSDVPVGYWAYTHIEYCRSRGLAAGYADGYHPDGVVTRDQLAVFITRAFGLG